MQGHVKNTSPRDDERSIPKGWVRGNTKGGPVLQVNVTNYLERYGIEIKTDSMQNDGSQSWIVISRGMNKYVSELPEENGKSIHHEEATTSTGRPIDQRNWKDIPDMDHVDERSLSFNVSSSRKRWSNGMEHIATCVMSRLQGTPQDGRNMCELITCMKVAKRKHFSIV